MGKPTGFMEFERLNKDEIKVEICSECHPFYTGKQKNIEAGGRIDKFKKRFKMD